MGVAILASKRSKDPNTQVGACIVDNKDVYKRQTQAIIPQILPTQSNDSTTIITIMPGVIFLRGIFGIGGCAYVFE